MRKVQVYIEGQRLELFNDESINVNSSVQNYKDLAKLFTDFSQSFSVPATPHNNQIFEHFYQTDVNGALNYQLRRAASIEIDLIPFRTGKIQLEKANVKDNMPYSYTITFYGDIRTLADLFGDDKLSSLDYSAYTHEYTGANVQTRITSGSSYDVRYPLISSSRLWSYGDSTNTDITLPSHALNYTELAPALRINRIIEAIETKYGIDFQGNFLTDKRFTNCYLYLKNTDTFVNYTNEQVVDIANTSLVSSSPGITPAAVSNYFSEANDTLRMRDAFHPYTVVSHGIQYKITHASAPATWYIDVYKGGLLYTTVSGVGTTAWINLESVPSFTQGTNVLIDQTYQFKVRASNSMDIRVAIAYNVSMRKPTDLLPPSPPFTPVYVSYQSQGEIQSLSADLNIAKNMPDMLVKDFMAGILKEFNLTCYGLSPYTFKLQTLEEWYGSGEIVDFTKYTITDSIDYERVKLFKRISYEHEESKSWMNIQFKELFNRDYGSLEQAYDYDGEEYVVKVPFENLLHQKFTGTNLQVGYCLEPNDYKPYIPKPMLLYMYEQQACSFKFDNGTTTATISNYMPFGQDLYYNFDNLSLNFGNDISSLLEVNIPRGIYQEYYSPYILNLYQAKNRLVYVKMILPVTKLTRLKLNDRIVIRDKRYIINEMKSNLTTGEVDFVLMLDFREVKPKQPRIVVPRDGGEITYPWALPNGVSSVSLAAPTGVTTNPSTFTEDEQILMVFDPNTDEIDTFITEASEDFIFEDYLNIRSEEGSAVSHTITVTETYQNGDTNTYDFIIQQAG